MKSKKIMHVVDKFRTWNGPPKFCIDLEDDWLIILDEVRGKSPGAGLKGERSCSFWATYVPALHQLDLHISKTCSVYTYRLGSGSKCICDLMYLECP